MLGIRALEHRMKHTLDDGPQLVGSLPTLEGASKLNVKANSQGEGHAEPSFLFGWTVGRRPLSGIMGPFGWEIHLKAWLSRDLSTEKICVIRWKASHGIPSKLVLSRFEDQWGEGYQ